MPSSQRWVGYVIAVLATAAVAAGRYAFDQRFGAAPHFLLPFVVPALLAARFGGGGPGLFATALSAVVVLTLFDGPARGLDTRDAADLLRVVLFVGIGVFVSAVCERFHRDRRRAEVAAAQSAQRQQELQAEVAERREAGRRLLASQSLLRLVTDHGPVLLVHCDRDMRYTFVNRTYAERFGLDAEAVVGRTIPEVLGPTGYDRIKGHLAAALAGATVEFEVDMPYPATGLRRVHCTCRPAVGVGGGVDGFVATIQDITERVRTAAALRESEERYRVLTDALPHMVWAMRPDLTLDFLNSRSSEFTGLSADQVNAEGWGRLVHPDDLPGMTAAVAGPLGRGEPHDAEYRFRHHTGEYRWVVSRAVPVRAADGTVARWVGSTSDIHDRRVAEGRLRASERRYKAVIQATPQVVWTSGGTAVEMGWWTELTGQPADEAAGWGWLNAVHPDDRERVRAAWTTAYAARTLYDTEYRVRTRSGEYRHFAARGVALSDADGGLEEWVGTLADVHDRTVAQEQLRELNATLERRVDERTAEVEAQRRLLDAVLEALPVPVIIADHAGAFFRVNRACHEVCGDTPAATGIEDYPAWVGFWPTTGRRVGPHEWPLSRAVFGGETCVGQVISIERFGDHRRRTLQISAAPVRAADGATIAGVVVGVDVTDREAAAAALRESEERFRSAFESAAIGMALVGTDGRWLRVNRSLCEMMGYAADELLATDFQTITHPDDLDADLGHVRELLAGTLPAYQMEKRYFHKAGRVVHVLLSVSLVRDGAGTPLYFVSQINDTTRRKEAERGLAANAALLRQFIKHSPAAIAMFDRGVRYLQASDHWLTDYRLAGREIIGLSHYDVFPDIPDGWKEVHRRVLGGAVERCDEEPFHRRDGSTEWLQWECRPWHDADGEVGGLVMFTQVVTERRLAAERVRASLREKEVLLKEIHHRVKNNLQIVSALLELQAEHTDDPRTLGMFEESRGRVKSMALIHERLYSSDDMARVDFAEYVRQLADDLYRTYKVSDDDIRLELAVDIPPLPIDIAIPCGLLLNELMSNCFKHAFRNADSGCIRVSLHRDGVTNVLVVADDGAGFPAGTDIGDTTSFGLQLVQTLAEQLRGGVELTADRGATFTVRFPKPKSKKPPHPEAHP